MSFLLPRAIMGNIIEEDDSLSIIMWGNIIRSDSKFQRATKDSLYPDNKDFTLVLTSETRCALQGQNLSSFLNAHERPATRRKLKNEWPEKCIVRVEIKLYLLPVVLSELPAAVALLLLVSATRIKSHAFLFPFLVLFFFFIAYQSGARQSVNKVVKQCRWY